MKETKKNKNEYRATIRVPAEYGDFLKELAYQNRNSVTGEINRLVKEEMDKRPEIMGMLNK